MRSIRRYSMLLLLSLIGGMTFAIKASADSSQGQVVPTDLREYALAQKCAPVDDFYDGRPGDVLPPYVYAKDLNGPEAAAALWCREEKSGKSRHTLLFRKGRGSVGQGTCPSRIPRQGHIGGLSLIHKSDLKLNMFRFVDTPSLSGPPSEPLKGLALKSEYDGVGSIFYCHQGKWLVYRFD